MFCRHEEGAKHDCDYVNARNKYIARAEAYANATVPDDGSPDWSWRWDKVYLAAMETMVKELN